MANSAKMECASALVNSHAGTATIDARTRRDVRCIDTVKKDFPSTPLDNASAAVLPLWGNLETPDASDAPRILDPCSRRATACRLVGGGDAGEAFVRATPICHLTRSLSGDGHPCIGSRCSAWAARTVGTPPIASMGQCGAIVAVVEPWADPATATVPK